MLKNEMHSFTRRPGKIFLRNLYRKSLNICKDPCRSAVVLMKQWHDLYRSSRKIGSLIFTDSQGKLNMGIIIKRIAIDQVFLISYPVYIRVCLKVLCKLQRKLAFISLHKMFCLKSRFLISAKFKNNFD